jgi:membrane-associated phospholipid phosphatase
LCALAEAILALLAFGFEPSKALERRVWRSVAGPDPGDLHGGFIGSTVTYLHPRYYVEIGIVVVAVIVIRRRWRLAVAVVFLLAATPVAAEVLKNVLDYPRLRPFTAPGQARISPASWPSGHTAAAAALGLALTVAVPRAVRWCAAVVGALLVAGVSADVVLSGAHFPSDALGGYLLAGICFCLIMAVSTSAPLGWQRGV